jgi:hypothetical protein
MLLPAVNNFRHFTDWLFIKPFIKTIMKNTFEQQNQLPQLNSNALEYLPKQALDKDTLQQKWMDSCDVRELLHISRGTLYNWCRKGLLAFSKVEGKIYFEVKEVEAMLHNAKRSSRPGVR